jgi:hypothetical protein
MDGFRTKTTSTEIKRRIRGSLVSQRAIKKEGTQMQNEIPTLDIDLIAAMTTYFSPVGRWKKAIGISSDKTFSKFTPSVVRSMVRSLNEIGVLEKNFSSDKKGTIYRLNASNLEAWHKITGILLAGGSLLPALSLRDLATLYVIGKFQVEHGLPPRTSELFYKDSQRQNLGLINEFMFETSMIDDVVFEITSTVHIHQAAGRLAQHGFMTERGSRAQAVRKAFELTRLGAGGKNEKTQLAGLARSGGWPIR